MKEQILPINLLRFLAALGILFVHKFNVLLSIGYIPSIFNFLAPFTQYGYLGVNLFFLISGFVISLSSEGRTVGEFISARFIRLFPVFWICVSITTLFVLSAGNYEHLTLVQYLANLTMIPSAYGAYPLIDGSYWTLGIELKFYFAVALIILLQKLPLISLQRIALFLTLPVLYLTLYFNPYHISFTDNIFLTILSYFGSEYAQYFIAGILFYGVYARKSTRLHYPALITCYIVALLRALDQSYPLNNPSIIMLHVTVFFGVFLAIANKSLTSASLSFLGKNYTKIIVTLGAVTYPLYLLHSVIIGILIETFKNYDIPSFLASPLLIITVSSLVVSVNQADTYIHTLWKKSFLISSLTKKLKSIKIVHRQAEPIKELLKDNPCHKQN